MRIIAKAVLFAAFAVSSIPAVHAWAADAEAGASASEPMSVGEVKKVDQGAGKITIRHGPLRNIGMGAMTMVFRVRDPAMLEQVHAGDTIRFIAEQPNGQLTVTRMEKPQ